MKRSDFQLWPNAIRLVKYWVFINQTDTVLNTASVCLSCEAKF